MTLKPIEKALSRVLCLALLALGVPAEPLYAFQDQAPSQASSSPSTSAAAPAVAPLSSDQLDAMVAPIALYPDALVAQVLGAATYPDQVAIADYWLAQNKNLTGTPLAQAVDQQSWDPSVKALTQFPSVLDDLAQNLAWTSSLGQAFQSQQADVMAAVQAMRAKAQTAGTLKSTPQVTVVQQTPQTIVIQPADPKVVYVPQYNPTVVYGTPYVVPLYTPAVTVAAATLSFGAGVAIGAVIGGGGGGFVAGGGGGFGWGFSAWHCNWGGGGGGGNIIFNNNTYISNNNWHGGGYYPGYHPWGPGPHPYGPNGGGYVPTRDQPNGGRNGDHGLIGGNGGVQHSPGYVPTRDQPNGGRNGDHGLIGGNGGTQHLLGGGATQNPNGGEPGTQHVLGSNNSGERDMPGQRDNQRGGEGGRPNNMGGGQTRSRMSGDGAASRAESNRGRASMHPSAVHRAPMRTARAPHPQPNRGGGGRRR